MCTHYLMRKRVVDNEWRFNLLDLATSVDDWYYKREDNVFVSFESVTTVPINSVMNPFG